MHCPRCGSPNEPGDRYCAACGAQLKASDSAKESRSGGSRVSQLIGGDRKSRIVTGTTIGALAVAVVAFFALSSGSEDSIPRDHYTLSAERICLKSKQAIVGAAREGGGSYVRQLVPIVVSWREQLAELNPPTDRRQKAEDLDTALREVEIEAATTARFSEQGNDAKTAAAAKRAEAASAAVEQAVASPTARAQGCRATRRPHGLSMLNQKELALD